MHLPERLYTEEEVALFMGVSVHGVRKWRQKGHITFIKVDKTIRFRQSDLEDFIRRHTRERVA